MKESESSQGFQGIKKQGKRENGTSKDGLAFVVTFSLKIPIGSTQEVELKNLLCQLDNVLLEFAI